MSYPYARGSNKPMTKILCTMWGLWLVVSITEVHQYQAAACQTASPKVIQKLSSFDEKRAVNIRPFQQQLTGQLWQCAIPSQSAVQLEPHA